MNEKKTEWLEKLEYILRQRHLKPIDLQRGAGIPAASLTRIFKYGRRATFLNNLDKLAVFFGVRPRELLGEPLQVPVVGEVTATKGFDYSKVDKIFPRFTVPCLAGLMLKDVERMYGLQVADHSMEPVFPKRSIIYAMKESHGKIESGNQVIYVDDQSIGYVKLVKFTDEYLVLDCINFQCDPLVKPKTGIKMLDTVMGCFNLEKIGT